MEEDVIVVEGVRLVAKINTDSLIGISGLTEKKLALYALGDSHVCFRQTSNNQYQWEDFHHKGQNTHVSRCIGRILEMLLVGKPRNAVFLR